MEEPDFEEEDMNKRFECVECGHTFVMECETPDMIPNFCPFCASPVYIKDDDEFDDDEPYGYHL
tara:strand:+ start:2199 stop:2390 length:192 start_codon:yes stop_codon:yes gene_type:complete